MVSKRRVRISLISAACLVGHGTAVADGTTSRPRALIIDFTITGSGGAGPEAPLASVLEREFFAIGVGANTARSDIRTKHEQLLRIPTGRMRARLRTGTATHLRDSLSSSPSPSANCPARTYIPSNLLGHDAEERRRILYPLVRSTACEAGLPIGLMDAMLIQESRYNPLATSPKGAFGLGQLMPGTAVQLGVDRFDLRGNLAGAARYLRQHIDEFGQVPLALAAYNAGPTRVRKSWSIPRISETQNYVRQILINWRTLEFEAATGTTPLGQRATHQSSLVSRFP